MTPRRRRRKQSSSGKGVKSPVMPVSFSRGRKPGARREKEEWTRLDLRGIKGEGQGGDGREGRGLRLGDWGRGIEWMR